MENTNQSTSYKGSLDDTDDENDEQDDNSKDNDASSIESGPLHFEFSPEDMIYEDDHCFNEAVSMKVRLRKAKSLDDLDAHEPKLSVPCSKSRSLDDLDCVCMKSELDKLNHEIESVQKTLRDKDIQISRLKTENNKTELMQTILDLRLECTKKDNEIKRLSDIEKSLKQTKQVLKDTTWTLKVKEEELNSTKTDMRKNYEKRLNEILSQLNEKEAMLAEYRSENISLQEIERNNLLQIDELRQQIKLSEKQPRNQRKSSVPVFYEATSTPIQKIKRSNSLATDFSFTAVPEEEEECTINHSTNKDSSVEELLQRNKENERKIEMLESDLAKSKTQVGELYKMLEGASTNSDLLPTTQVEHAAGATLDPYLLHVSHVRHESDSADGLEDLNSLLDDVHSIASDGDFSEGRLNLRKQMEHTVKKYEDQIKELQKLYDNDILVLENENKDLKSQLEGTKKSISSLNSSVIDTEDLREQYENKISYMKKYYDEQENKHLQVAKEEIHNLCVENEELKNTLTALDEQHQRKLKKLEEELMESFAEKIREELQHALEQRQSSLSSAQEQLQDALKEIQYNHNKIYNDINDKFSKQTDLSELEDSYSKELLLLHEDKAYLEHKVQSLQDELMTVQTEYDHLKETFDEVNTKYEATVNADVDVIKLKPADVTELQQCVNDINKSILVIQSEIGSSINESHLEKSEFHNIGLDFHKDIKLLRANLDDAKSDVENLVSERDKFSQLSSTLSNQLTALKSELENQESKHCSKLSENENKIIEKFKSDKQLWCKTFQEILCEMNTSINKKVFLAKNMDEDDSLNPLVNFEDNSELLSTISENVNTEVYSLITLDSYLLSNIFMKQCELLIIKLEHSNQEKLDYMQDTMAEEFSKNLSLVNEEHNSGILKIKDEMEKQLLGRENNLLEQQKQVLLEKELKMKEQLAISLQKKDDEFKHKLHEVVVAKEIEMASQLEEALNLKEHEMLQKLHQAILEKEKEMQQRMEESLQSKTDIMMANMKQKDEQHILQLEKALLDKEETHKKKLLQALLQKENELHSVFLQREEEQIKITQEKIDAEVARKEAEINQKFQETLLQKEKLVEQNTQVLLDKKTLEMEEKLKEVIHSIQSELGAQQQQAIDDTQSEMNDQLNQAVIKKQHEMMEHLYAAVADKETEMNKKLVESVKAKEDELLETKRLITEQQNTFTKLLHEKDESADYALLKLKLEKESETEALVFAHDEELKQIKNSLKLKLIDRIDHEKNKSDILRKRIQQASCDVYNQLQVVKDSYKKNRKEIESTLKTFQTCLNKSNSNIEENLLYKYNKDVDIIFSKIAEIVTTHVLQSSLDIVQEEELLRKLRKMFKRAVKMQKEHLEFFEHQIHNKLNDLLNKCSTLEQRVRMVHDSNDFEDSIEQIAEEYVVLALQNSVTNAKSRLLTNETLKKEHAVNSSFASSRDISVQSDTVVKEEKLVELVDQNTQTCMVHESMFTQTETNFPTLEEHILLQKIIEEQKIKLTNLSSTNKLLLKNVNDYETQGREQMKNDLMRQHELILDEFIKEQEQEMQKLETDHATQMAKTNTDMCNAIKELKLEVQLQLDQHGDESLSTDISLANVTETPKEDWSADLVELKGLIRSFKAKHAEELATCEEETRLTMEQEHLDHLSELEGELQKKHVEQLEKLNEFQQVHLKEISRLQDEHKSQVEGMKEDYERELKLLLEETAIKSTSSTSEKETMTAETNVSLSNADQHRRELLSSNEDLRTCLTNIFESLQQTEHDVQDNMEAYIKKYNKSDVDLSLNVINESSFEYPVDTTDVKILQEKASDLGVRMNAVILHLLHTLDESNNELNDHVLSYNTLSEDFENYKQLLTSKKQENEALQKTLDENKESYMNLERKYQDILEKIDDYQQETMTTFSEKGKLYDELSEQADQLSKLTAAEAKLKQHVLSCEQKNEEIRKEQGETLLERDALVETNGRLEDEVSKMTKLYEEAEQYNNILGAEIENIKQSLESGDNELKTRCVALEEECAHFQQSLKVETGKNQQLLDTLNAQNKELNEIKVLQRETDEHCQTLEEECEELRKLLDIEIEKNEEMHPIFAKQAEELTKLREMNTDVKCHNEDLLKGSKALQCSLQEKENKFRKEVLLLEEECEHLKELLKEQNDKNDSMNQLHDEQTNELSELRERYKTVLEDFEEMRETEQARSVHLESQCKKLQHTIEEQHIRNRNLEETLQGQENELFELKSFQNESNERCISLDNECVEVKHALEKVKQTNKDKEEAISLKDEEIVDLKQLNTELSERCSNLEERCLNSESALKTLENDTRERCSSLTEQYEQLQKVFSRENKKNKELYELHDSQSVELAEVKAIYNTDKITIKELTERCDDLVQSLEEGRSYLEDYELTKQQCEMLQSSLESVKEMHAADQELLKEQELLYDKMTIEHKKELDNTIEQLTYEHRLSTAHLLQEHEVEMARLEEKLKDKENLIARLEAEIIQERSERKRYEAKAGELDQEIDDLRSEVSTLNQLIEETNQTVTSARDWASKKNDIEADSTMKILLSDIQQEADDVLQLVLDSPDFYLEGEWNAEKQALLDNIRALRDLSYKNKENLQKTADENVTREVSKLETKNRDLRASLDDLRTKLSNAEANLKDAIDENRLLKEETEALNELLVELSKSEEAVKKARIEEREELTHEVNKCKPLAEALRQSQNELKALNEQFELEKGEFLKRRFQDEKRIHEYEAMMKAEANKQDALKEKLDRETAQAALLKNLLQQQKENIDKADALNGNNVDREKYDRLKAAYAEERHKSSRLHKAMRKNEDEMQTKINNLQNINESLQNDVEDLIGINKNNNGGWDQRSTLPGATEEPPHTHTEQSPLITENQKKLLDAGWTLAKVQRLYLKYFRAESFRRALSYQKRYLLILLQRYEGMRNLADSAKQPFLRFKSVAITIVAINRMKYLVRKYQRNLHKSSSSYQFKDSRPGHKHSSRIPPLSLETDSSDVNLVSGVPSIITNSSISLPKTASERARFMKYPHNETASVATTAVSSVNATNSEKFSITEKPGGEGPISRPSEESRSQGLLPTGIMNASFAEGHDRYNNLRLSSEESIDFTIEQDFKRPVRSREWSYEQPSRASLPSEYSNSDIIAKAHSVLGKTRTDTLPSHFLTVNHNLSSLDQTYHKNNHLILHQRRASSLGGYDEKVSTSNLGVSLGDRNTTRTNVPCSYPRPTNSNVSPSQHSTAGVIRTDISLKCSPDENQRTASQKLNKENNMLNDYIRKLESLQHRLKISK